MLKCEIKYNGIIGKVVEAFELPENPTTNDFDLFLYGLTRTLTTISDHQDSDAELVVCGGENMAPLVRIGYRGAGAFGYCFEDGEVASEFVSASGIKSRILYWMLFKFEKP